VFVAVMVWLTLAGCGGSTATTPSPSPSPSESSLASRLAALKAYKDQIQPIVTQLSATATSLPAAVKGLNTRPDSTWTASATKLDAVASELGAEAASLAALTPPSALAPVQAAAVKGIQDAQAAITKTADALNKRVVTAATKGPAIRSQMDDLKTQISELSDKVTSAIDSVTP
jgi:chaperonin cofactor prefoldin